ncbi:MAG: Single-stranded DNA-binding protein [Gemmatimonadaceae bacterium]|nr:Single-stranded DNA-binding protein [Gemmatimonadaceae bacterium]
MSRSLNKIMLIGNVGNDPEIRTTSNGAKVAQLNLATTRTWNGPGGDRQEKTEWHRCVLWNGKGSGLADIVERYVRKGDRLYVEGRVEYRQWQDKEGQTRYTTEINVREMLMLSSRGGASADGETGGSRPRSQVERTRTPAASSAASGGDFEDFPEALADEDDDLPF